ncbi:FeoC-like transcriptional regulator [Aquicoccus sp. SU-CL01552]|uniref:FeoC-like transcriptional regulator n=1 Tax=Aquicoccus sp. SU-CL01552 TaxID=3127656 RepID=UPI003105CDCC
MLQELRTYVERNGAVSILDLSNHFHVAPDALRGMLDHWVRKGVLSRQSLTTNCGGCASAGQCGGCGVLASLEIYEATS